MVSKKFDVCVRGAGIVGRALALRLAAQRLRVGLVQSPAGSAGHNDVRAYALNTRSKALLEGLRCWPDAAAATPVLAMQVHGDTDGAVQFAAREVGADALNWIVDVPALESLLGDAVRFQPQIEVLDAPAPAALTVICEGRASRTREELGIDFDVAAYGQTALAARVDGEREHGQIARQWFAHGDVLALLPLAGKRCALVWSLPPARAEELQACDPATFCEQLQQASHNELGAFQLCSERFSWPLQQANARHWCGQFEDGSGAWVLAGDAAHTVHPLAGQGLNLGLGDAAELVQLLDGRPYWRGVGDLRLLRQYERARKTELALIGGSGDALQRLFDRHNGLLQNIRNWGMQQFDRSGPLKHWIVDRAMGSDAPAHTPSSRKDTP